MFRTPDRLFRVLAIAEAITWTILISAIIARAAGAPGVVVSRRGRPFMVSEVEVVDGKVHHQYWVVNPDKLASIGREIELV